MFVLPAIAGVAIGILSGLLGIGGGTVMVPIFRLAFGMSPVVSTATSLFAIIPTSISGAASHIRHKTCIVSLGVAAGLGGALTSPLGVWLAQISPAWMIMVAAALIIGWSAVKMLGKAFKMRSQNRTQQHAASSSTIEPDEAAIERVGDAAANDDAIDDPTKVSAQAGAAVDPAPRKLTRKQLLIGAGIGLGAGVASGYVGVGGGFIMVPLMLSLIGIEMRQASGTSLIAVMILAIPRRRRAGVAGKHQLRGGHCHRRGLYSRRGHRRASCAGGSRARIALRLRLLPDCGRRHTCSQRIRYTGLMGSSALLGQG